MAYLAPHKLPPSPREKAVTKLQCDRDQGALLFSAWDFLVHHGKVFMVQKFPACGKSEQWINAAFFSLTALNFQSKAVAVVSKEWRHQESIGAGFSYVTFQKETCQVELILSKKTSVATSVLQIFKDLTDIML